MLFLRRILCVTTLALGLTPVVMAVPFSTVGAGGVATVGVGGDYESLHASSLAFNALEAPALQGNWKLEILNDLTEPQSVGFANELLSGSLTIKPAAGTSVTVTFTGSSNNGAVVGSWLLGVQTPMAVPSDYRKTSNVSIDGSNDGSGGRNMTIRNLEGGKYTHSSVVSIAGEIISSGISNCTLINRSSDTQADNVTPAPAWGIAVTSRYDVVNQVPGNIVVANNHVVVGQQESVGIILRGFTAAGATRRPAMRGFRVADNVVESRVAGITLANGLDGQVDGNYIRCGHIGAPVDGVLQTGVLVSDSGDMDDDAVKLSITRNRIFMQSANATAGDVGVVAILSLNMGGSAHFLDVINNMIDFRFTNTADTTARFNYSAIDLRSAATARVMHNSVNMPHFEHLKGLAAAHSANLVSAAAVRLPVSQWHDAQVTNNLFRVEEGLAAVLVYARGITVSPRSLVSDNNVIYCGENTAIGVSGINFLYNYVMSLPGWQTETSLDTDTQIGDPMTGSYMRWNPAPGTADLHFVSWGGNVLFPNCPLEPDVLTDIDGDMRPTRTTPGADQFVDNSAVNDWSVY